MPWFAWLLVGLNGFVVFANVALIGAPRKPITPGVACATLIVNGLLIWGIVTMVRGGC